MEESEKRKQRLRAMRMEAARAESSSYPEALPGPGSLVNPLTETSGPPLVQEESLPPPRFDYYTDPMSAFSANKRMNNPGNLAQHKCPTPNRFPNSNAPLPSVSEARILETSSSHHVEQQQARYSPHQTMYQPHTPQPNLAQYQSPGATSFPSPMPGGVPSQSWNVPTFHHQYNNALSSGFLHNPSFGQYNSPSFSPRHVSPHWQGNSPRSVGPRPSSGGGRAQWSVRGGSPGLGRSSGRGVGFRGRGYGAGKTMGPEQFYHDSMIEDPWKDMVAVVWTPVGAPSPRSWMPESVRAKRPRIAEPPNKFSGGLNLAEFLAANFQETANETETETATET